MTPDPPVEQPLEMEEGSEKELPSESENDTRQPGWIPDDAEASHLLVVNWETEAQRVQMNKAIRPYNDENLIKPPGTVRVLTDKVNVEDLMSSLVTKVPIDSVYLADLDEESDLQSYLEKKATLRHTFDDVPDNIENMLTFIITNAGGKMQSPKERRFEITRNGYVDVTYTIEEDGTVEITFNGHAEAVTQLREEFRESLEQLAEGTASESTDSSSAGAGGV